MLENLGTVYLKRLYRASSFSFFHLIPVLEVLRWRKLGFKEFLDF
jgi:hypothetical protein